MMQQQMAGLRAALSGDPGDDIVVLAMLLVEQAIKIAAVTTAKARRLRSSDTLPNLLASLWTSFTRTRNGQGACEPACDPAEQDEWRECAAAADHPWGAEASLRSRLI